MVRVGPFFVEPVPVEKTLACSLGTIGFSGGSAAVILESAFHIIFPYPFKYYTIVVEIVQFQRANSVRPYDIII